jgi:peptide/nickel transport system substrate-binding protein
VTKHFKSMLAATALGSIIAFGAQAEEPVRGGTLIHTMGTAPRHLNPAVQSGIATGAPGAQLFAAPLRYDEDWTPQPYLAESWGFSDDGLKMTLNLVKGATFHDGAPITSEDVAFSVKTVQENHPFKSMFDVVTSVDTPDEHTAILNLSQPHPALLLAMSSQLLPIIPKHVYGDGQDVKTHPQNNDNVVGSGPFKLVEHNRDQNIVLERFDDFFIEGRPYLDRIVYRIIKDASSRSIGLENGELHMATFENVVRNIARMKENENLTVTDEGYAAIGALNWLAFNTGSEGPLSDKRVRQAIA